MSTPVPEPPPLVVAVEDVAAAAGIELPLTPDQETAIRRGIATAQADVHAYLGRPVTPVAYTDTGAWPYPDGWRLAHEPVVDILSTTPETDAAGGQTGYYTVVYTAGLDGANDPELAPIRRYVTAHAAALPAVAAHAPNAGRVVTSVSAEGQSISYASPTQLAPPGSGTPGALPTLSSLDRWRVAGRRVFQRRSYVPAPWPYGW